MTIDSCPKLCEDCPIRDRIRGEPTFMAEVEFVVPGSVRTDKYPPSFELSRGIPVNYGNRISTIVIANQARQVGFYFHSPGTLLDNGTVANTFENCSGPIRKRTGLFWFRTWVGCAALAQIRQA